MARKSTTRRRRATKLNGAANPAQSTTKLGLLGALLQRDEGATIGDLTKATGWQPHSVRGAISGTFKKKRGLNVTSEVVEGRGRVYKVAGGRR